jgi:hypothetical protein
MKESGEPRPSISNVLSYRLSPRRECQVVGESEETVTLESKSQIRAELSKSLLEANLLEIHNGFVLLSQGLYDIHFVQKPRKESLEKMNSLFNKNITKIFKNKDLILNKPEYYYLTPSYLVSGAAYIGDFRFCLGALLETFSPAYQIFPPDFEPFKNLYLIRLGGSPLSGSFSATFWSPEIDKIVCFNSSDKIRLPKLFIEHFHDFKDKSFAGLEVYDFQDRSIEQLLKEIESKENK